MADKKMKWSTRMIENYGRQLTLSTSPKADVHASGSLHQQHACCGMMVLTGWFARTAPYLLRLVKQAEKVARTNGYTAIMATVNETGNPGQVTALTKAKWTRSFGFTNDRTGNTVGMWCKQVIEDPRT